MMMMRHLLVAAATVLLLGAKALAAEDASVVVPNMTKVLLIEEYDNTTTCEGTKTKASLYSLADACHRVQNRLPSDVRVRPHELRGE